MQFFPLFILLYIAKPLPLRTLSTSLFAAQAGHTHRAGGLTPLVLWCFSSTRAARGRLSRTGGLCLPLSLETRARCSIASRAALLLSVEQFFDLLQHSCRQLPSQLFLFWLLTMGRLTCASWVHGVGSAM
jgi:hypothetical protein